MGRNEIRLRRQMMSSGRIARHRNYGDIMARHERDVRLKRIFRVFIYFLIILFFLIVFFMVRYWEDYKSINKPTRPQNTSALVIDSLNSGLNSSG